MKLLKQLKWYFFQEYKKYLITIFLLISISILQLYPPKLIEILIDSINNKTINTKKMFFLISLILIIATIIYILRYMWRIFLFGTSYKLAIILRTKIYNYLTKKNNYFYLNNPKGDLITKATNDVDRIVFSAGEGILTLLDSLIMGISVIVIMITKINWKLTIVSLLPMPIMVLIIKHFGNTLQHSYQKAQQSFSFLNNYTQESLNNIYMIKSFGLEKYHNKKFIDIAKITSQKNIETIKIDAKFDPVIHLSISISHLLTIVIGSYMVANKEISIGQLISFILYLGLMIWPMLALAWMFNIMERGHASWNRIKLMIKNTAINQKNYKKIPKNLELLNVKINSFKYEKNKKFILKNINFSLYPGQILGICGPVGSGKSTLLKLLQQQLKIKDGNISYNSIPIQKFHISHWRKKVTIVDQTTFLFSDTILNNIKLGKKHTSEQEIKYVTHLSDFYQDITQLPKKYNTQIGEKGVMLSGGQKQRISIARALLSNPEILILDDALSAIDFYTEKKILKNFYTWKKDHNTIIICSHKISSLKNANIILVIQNGSITQKGTHSQLIKDTKQWYGKTYFRQKKIISNNK
ncbi:MAG: ABC transporter transmembrane domain-containing protein [Buchnera aphidicola (Chaetogeoica yunlongensis)]